MTEASPTATTLRDTMRGLRIAEAERNGVVVALRDAEFARLAMLHDRLKPILAEVPAGIDLFDAGLTPGETPRLWIDMIAFVEMGRDKRSYRFLQDTRDGRRVLAEGPDAAVIADRITAYIARRLIERERLLALPPVAVEPDAPAAPLPRAEVPARLLSPVAAQETARAATFASVPDETLGSSRVEPAQGTARAAPDGDAASRAATPPEAVRPLSPSRTTEAGGDKLEGRQPRVRFSGLGGFILFVLGIAVGAGGLLAIAQIAARL